MPRGESAGAALSSAAARALLFANYRNRRLLKREETNGEIESIAHSCGSINIFADFRASPTVARLVNRLFSFSCNIPRTREFSEIRLHEDRNDKFISSRLFFLSFRSFPSFLSFFPPVFRSFVPLLTVTIARRNPIRDERNTYIFEI